MVAEVLGSKIVELLKFSLYKIAESELSKIQKFKNIHKGQEGYIFGDGVSLKWFDLNHFSDKVSLAAGSLIPFHNSFSTLNIQHLLLTEPFWFYPRIWTKYISHSVSMPEISKAYREVIKSNQDKNFILNFSNFPVIGFKNVTYLFRDIADHRLSRNFISRRIDPFNGSLRAAIVMAIYMGFDRIYLVGCDYTHVPSRTLHWYEKGYGIFIQQDLYNKDFFSIAKEYIDLITITLDGTGNFIEAITYKDYTGSDPIYRENSELVNDNYLKILSSWPNYNIY
jgi:hypothetical protein